MSKKNKAIVPVYISEEQVAEIVNSQNIMEVVEKAFASMFKNTARNFPVVRESLGHKDALYGFKSGFDSTEGILGLKAGGYWPHNPAQNDIACHQSTIALFNPDTGMLKALVSGNRLTALRTAAASAVSIKHLARKDAKTLGIIGAGGQSAFQVLAAIKQRDFSTLMIGSRTQKSCEKLASDIAHLDANIVIAPIKEVAENSDVLITIMSSWDAQVKSDWIKPGTHIACMGTDTAGKQEVEQGLVAQADVYTDEISQAISIGECQHAYSAGLIGESDITPIGSVISGDHSGRQSDTAITLFDSTGVGLQDLAAADFVLRSLSCWP